MSARHGPGLRFSLSRWSRRKLEAARATPAALPPATVSAPAPAAVTPVAVELPPVESLTFASDFTVFLRPEVDDKIKRAALKQLFRDPRFNVMDGLDTYIDDYTQADPIAADVLTGLLQRFGGAPEAGDATEGARAVQAAPSLTGSVQPAQPAESTPEAPSIVPGSSAAGADQDAPVPPDAEDGNADAHGTQSGDSRP